jgi:simple sugar transport system ATP-binding protein
MRAIVFDEPTAVLAESEADRLLRVMRVLADSGLAILFITHRLDEVMAVADRVTILRDGALALTAPRSELTIERIAETMVGRSFAARAAQSAPLATSREDAAPILEIRDLRVDMPGERVLGVDLSVRRGEILGIGGLAGQGKIGIANGVMGLFPAEGSVRLEGRALPLGDPRGARAAGLAFVSEDRRGTGLLLDEPLAMNIAIPAMEVRGRFLRAPRLRALALVDRAAVHAHATGAIAELDIRTTGPDQPVRRLSGGNQQKVCLAAALATDPRLLFVSEPTRGIDIGAKRLVLDRLVALNEGGMTIVMTSSELVELRSICHRIAIVFEGRIAGVLPPDAPDVRFGLLMSGKGAG